MRFTCQNFKYLLKITPFKQVIITLYLYRALCTLKCCILHSVIQTQVVVKLRVLNQQPAGYWKTSNLLSHCQLTYSMYVHVLPAIVVSYSTVK